MKCFLSIVGLILSSQILSSQPAPLPPTVSSASIDNSLIIQAPVIPKIYTFGCDWPGAWYVETSTNYTDWQRISGNTWTNGGEEKRVFRTVKCRVSLDGDGRMYPQSYPTPHFTTIQLNQNP